MSDKPDLVYQVGARTHGVTLLLFFGVVWTAAVAFALFVHDLPGWWVVLWIAAATFTTAFVAARVLPFVIRGGAYRLVVQDGWLRAESPHPALGPSFAVALSTISKLVVCPYNDGPDTYEVHTSSGETFRLEEGLGPGVFAVIHRLYPNIPIERCG